MVSFFSEVTFQSKSFIEKDDLDLFCSVSEGSYSNVTLLKVTGQGQTETVMAVMRSDGTAQVVTDRDGGASVVTRGTGDEFTLTLADGRCGDDGTYACRHDNGQTSFGQVSITSEFLFEKKKEDDYE